VPLDLFYFVFFVQEITESQTMQEYGPGDVDPEQEKEYGTDASIDRSIGFVVYDIKDKTAFGEIPDQ
jgi:hypothetical protein